MNESKDLIIISASCGKNLELSEKFLEKSNALKISSEILDLTTLDIPLFNPRIHSKENIPNEIIELKKKLFKIEPFESIFTWRKRFCESFQWFFKIFFT